jgi:hypothetical protein
MLRQLNSQFWCIHLLWKWMHARTASKLTG